MQHHQQSSATIEGIVPVMLTPFDDAGTIDTRGSSDSSNGIWRTVRMRCSRSRNRARCNS